MSCNSNGIKPVDQIEEEFAGFIDRIGVGKQMSRLFSADKFAVVGAEPNRSVLLPFHLKQGVRTPRKKNY